MLSAQLCWTRVPWSQVELLLSIPGFPQSKHDQVQKKLESVEKQLEEAQQLVQLREMKISGSGGGRGVPSGVMHVLGIQPDLWDQHDCPSKASCNGQALPPLSSAAPPAPGHPRVFLAPRHSALLTRQELAATARSHTALALAGGWGCRQGLCLRALLALGGTWWHCLALPAALSVFEACFGVMRGLLGHKWDGMGWGGMGWDEVVWDRMG